MNEIYPKVSLKVAPDRIAVFLPFCRRGLHLRVQAGAVLHDFLMEIGFTEEYLENKIQTIFLDGKVVDDPHHETLSAGSVIALSAALPGLVGAMFRRKSPISQLRTRTEKPQSSPDKGVNGLVLLKLFNVVAEEMGPALLEREVIVRGNELEEEFANSDLLEQAITEALVDGNPVALSLILQPGFTNSEFIRLKVTV